MSESGLGVRPFVECVFDSITPGIQGVWWGYEYVGTTNISIPASSSYNSVSPKIESQPSIFCPGVHRYTFLSYFSKTTPLSWTVGDSTAAPSASTPQCRVKVFIQPKLDCVKEVGINPILTAQLSYTMESIEQSGSVVPYLEIPEGQHNSLSDHGTPTQKFYAGSHVRLRIYFASLICTVSNHTVFLLRAHHQRRSESQLHGLSYPLVADVAMFSSRPIPIVVFLELSL
jgi:hypothetical protein